MIDGPLEGVRVLDFTWALAGPFGSMILCDLGAEVIKIEPVRQTWQSRGNPPHIDGVSTYYFSINRGKRSILIDLKSETGKGVVYSLVKNVDVVWNNFSPGTMDDLGFSYEKLSSYNPSLIYAATSGFGQYGPYRQRRAVDVIVQGMSGLMSITGHPGGPPTRAGYSIGDMAGGMFTAIGILAALLERARSGLGQEIDVAMLDSQVALLENAMVRYFATGEVPERIGTRHPLLTPFQAFPTADGWVVVAGARQWDLFCIKLGLPDLALDERFWDNASRTRNHSDLEPILNSAFSRRTSAEWIGELSDVCMIAPLNTIADVAADPHLKAREAFVDLPHPMRAEPLRVANTPIKLSRTAAVVRRPPSNPGADTVDILKTLCGYTGEEIAAMIAEGSIGTEQAEG